MIRPRYDVKIVREDDKIIFYKRLNFLGPRYNTIYILIAFFGLFLAVVHFVR